MRAYVQALEHPKAFVHRRCPDGAGDDYNPSLYGLGLKMDLTKNTLSAPVARELVCIGIYWCQVSAIWFCILFFTRVKR